MPDKTVLITGANAGIGKATASQLARMGAHVVMVCRSRQRGESAQAEIKASSNNDRVDLLLADLSSQSAIRQLAADFKARYDRLHVLVNNAGGLFIRRQETVDGLEMTFALNHLAYFLLTNLLLDVLKASAPARIINVASAAHAGNRLNFDDLQNKQSYQGFRVYGESKLANILFTYELARRLENHNITVNAMHPGFVASNFAKNNGFLVRMVMNVIRLLRIGRTPEQGAATAVYLASSPDVAGITGQYFVDKKAVRSSNTSYDTAAAQRLWQVSEALTGGHK